MYGMPGLCGGRRQKSKEHREERSPLPAETSRRETFRLLLTKYYIRKTKEVMSARRKHLAKGRSGWNENSGQSDKISHIISEQGLFFVEEGKECPFYFRLIIIHENARMTLCKFFRGKTLGCANDWNGQFHQQNRSLIKN